MTRLFDTSDFPSRWTCGNWSEAHGWLHIGADIAIFGAYAAIPLSIAFYVARRPDISYPRIYWLFAAFIFSCGFTHLIEATIFWHPWYRLSGLAKLVTASVSWVAVFALVRALPQALLLPGIARLNAQLVSEIEERKSAENEVLRLNRDLQHRVEELEALLNVIPVGIGITNDPDAAHIRPNSVFARMLKMDSEANSSLSAGEHERPTHFRVLQGGRELSAEELPIQMAASTGEEIRDFEEEIVFDNGERLHVLGYASPLWGPEKSVRGAVGAFVDITARKIAEEERIAFEAKLQETQKLESVGMLAGGIAHDFNNLLTTILGNTSLTRLELPDSSPLLSHVEQIEEASQRAADLCKQMLAYAGKGKFELRMMDINRLVENTTHLFKASILNNAHLHLNLTKPLPSVHGDPSQLQQIVMNLVINASDAIGEKGGQITITTGRVNVTKDYAESYGMVMPLKEGEYVFVEVCDTGCGMTGETISHIFDPFFSTKFTGRGLGLAAVHGIVRSHNGGLKVYSEPGRGTTFKVLLPGCDAPVGQGNEPAVETREWKGEGQLLVIDDEAAVRNIASRMADVLGFSTLLAASGQEGLELFQKHRDSIAGVMLDLTMPVMGGEETFRCLRVIDPSVRVLLMSGFTEQEARSRFVGKNLSGFIQKPFGIRDLRQKLQELTASE